MAHYSSERKPVLLPEGAIVFLLRRVEEVAGLILMIFSCALVLAYLSYNPTDPSPLRAAAGPHRNLLGGFGAAVTDVGLQTLGVAYLMLIGTLIFWGWRMFAHHGLTRAWLRVTLLPVTLIFAALAFGALPIGISVYMPAGPGGVIGQIMLNALKPLGPLLGGVGQGSIGILGVVVASVTGIYVLGFNPGQWGRLGRDASNLVNRLGGTVGRAAHDAAEKGRSLSQDATLGGLDMARAKLNSLTRKVQSAAAMPEREQIEPALRREPSLTEGDGALVVPPVPSVSAYAPQPIEQVAPPAPPMPSAPVAERVSAPRPPRAAPRAPTVAAAPVVTPPAQGPLVLAAQSDYHLPSSDLLAHPPVTGQGIPDPAALEERARLLEAVLQDFGVRGRIVNVRPGPVVTVYELDPAPGTKSSRVIGLADDIARSLSAVAVRIAVVPGRSTIGIELPNPVRETVLLREVLEGDAFERSAAKLALVLGQDIGGAPVVEDLARMPHLLIAGTTGSGKSVGINTMILSLLYRLPPERCRFIMIDPKMLELSVYDGIPHLLTPVVTDPKKAVVALKWAVKEMENRYRGMAQLGVRNIESYNAKVAEITRGGAQSTRRVQVGFDEAGQPIYEDQSLDLQHLPYIVIVVDEMADLMMVAGKDIEAAIQRLAQMARAAGIHLIMATQRPSVDVITGTIKANFPSRISFRVTSKIDSRTILGEAGAEQLLGQGDMLVMLGGGRVDRVHGPFVSDQEVEQVVSFLKQQGTPDYLDSVTEDDEAPAGTVTAGNGDDGDDLYDQAVALVARERKASTSFIQRHLQIGYNRAARLVERMEAEGVVGAANHVGKREVLLPRHP